MRVIAVTGGIGSGKSTLTALYRALGAGVVDADAIAKSLTAPGGEALAPIRAAFGDAVFSQNGSLDRAALARRVFDGDSSALDTLNRIMHPRIIDHTRARLAQMAAEGVAAAVLDVPLLFETGMEVLADTVICASAPTEVRIRRIRRRDGLSREEALRRMASQHEPSVNEQRADYVISTDAPFPDTRRRARALWTRILAEPPRRNPKGTPEGGGDRVGNLAPGSPENRGLSAAEQPAQAQAPKPTQEPATPH